MNIKPEVGTYPRPDEAESESGPRPREGRRPPENTRHGPPAGWRVASLASGFLVLSILAGVVSLLAGMVLILPLAILAMPFVLSRMRKTRRRTLFPWPLSGLRRV